MPSFRLGGLILVLASIALAANRPSIEVSGNYVEARTADVYTGPCFANAEVQLVGDLAVLGWHINKGVWNGVSLDNLSVAAAVRASGTLGDQFHPYYPVKAFLMVDEKADPAQRLALQQFAKRMSGDLLQDVVRVEALPIEFKVDGASIHAGRVEMTAGTLAAIRTRAINAGDHICGNEESWYPPLTEVNHAMAAYALDHRFNGAPHTLNASWWSPGKRSAFVATFHLTE
jgi:hypothetical protein